HASPPCHSDTLSLHDALPISRAHTYMEATGPAQPEGKKSRLGVAVGVGVTLLALAAAAVVVVRAQQPTDEPIAEPAAPSSLPARSEEHTSELQSRENHVCRLL